jgi:hypothetical protein
MKGDGSEQRQVSKFSLESEGEGRIIQYEWSDDEEKIAFVTYAPPNTYEVFVSSLDVIEVRKVGEFSSLLGDSSKVLLQWRAEDDIEVIEIDKDSITGEIHKFNFKE